MVTDVLFFLLWAGHLMGNICIRIGEWNLNIFWSSFFLFGIMFYSLFSCTLFVPLIP
jgi:hypothetical protein